MNKRVKIVLLGFMLWVIKFIVGSIIFIVFGTEEHGPSLEVWWINGIQSFFLAFGLALALFLVYRDKLQNFIRTGWEAGITWYVILLLTDLIVLVGLFGLELGLWLPLILLNFNVVIITIIVGYLLARSKEKV